MHVLDNMVHAVRPGGTILDLQVIRPHPRVEAGGRVVCEVDGDPLFRRADAATAAVDALVGAGRLVETGRDDHDVREHYPSGADLVESFADRERRLPPDAVRGLQAMTGPCAVRERCRLRRLAVAGLPTRVDGLG